MVEFPSILSVVLDTTDVRGLAEFYRQLLGYEYRAGDAPPPDGADDKDWLVLSHPSGSPRLAFQRVAEQRRSTWPAPDVPQQLHLDLLVPTLDDFHANHARAQELGATVLYDRSADQQEPMYVYADPAGHPFCIFTWLT